jgi:hypothetical protein
VSQIISPILLAIFLAATGRDADAFVQRGFERARDAQWPSALALAHYAAGLASDKDAASGLEHLNRGLALAVEVGNRLVEAICQTLVNHLQSAVLAPRDLATALMRQLRDLQERGETHSALLVLSQVVVLMNHAERPQTAALICGWLNGRSGRSSRSVGDHDAAIESAQRTLGDQWDPMFQQGRNMPIDQLFEAAYDALGTIDESVPWRGAL